jgi:hypothetical protein
MLLSSFLIAVKDTSQMRRVRRELDVGGWLAASGKTGLTGKA